MSGFITKKLDNIKTLGEKLQKHRRQKGLSQEKAARAININARYIKNLEKDRYEALPADVYTINILKRYAELLDLNPATVIDLYKREKDLFVKTQLKKYQPKITRSQRFLNRILNPRALKYFVLVLLLVGILSYIGWGISRIISPPQLTVNAPPDNLITADSQLEISGRTEKEVTLAINNRPLLSDRDGNFSLTLDLQKGLNIIKISARKKHSKESVIYRKVIVTEE